MLHAVPGESCVTCSLFSVNRIKNGRDKQETKRSTGGGCKEVIVLVPTICENGEKTRVSFAPQAINRYSGRLHCTTLDETNKNQAHDNRSVKSGGNFDFANGQYSRPWKPRMHRLMVLIALRVPKTNSRKYTSRLPTRWE